MPVLFFLCLGLVLQTCFRVCRRWHELSSGRETGGVSGDAGSGRRSFRDRCFSEAFEDDDAVSGHAVGAFEDELTGGAFSGDVVDPPAGADASRGWEQAVAPPIVIDAEAPLGAAHGRDGVASTVIGSKLDGAAG